MLLINLSFVACRKVAPVLAAVVFSAQAIAHTNAVVGSRTPLGNHVIKSTATVQAKPNKHANSMKVVSADQVKKRWEMDRAAQLHHRARLAMATKDGRASAKESKPQVTIPRSPVVVK